MNKHLIKIPIVFGIISLLFGIMFKISHWPYADNMMIFGVGLIGFVFFPIYFFSKLKKHIHKIHKVADYIGFFISTSMALGLILKLLHNELGYIIYQIGMFSLIGLFTPLLTYMVIKNKENRLKRIMVITFSLLFFFLSFFLSSWMKTKEHIQIINMLESINQRLERQNQNLHNQNQADYTELLKNDSFKDNLLILKQQSDSIINFIHPLKIEILRNCSENDSMLNQLLFEKNKVSILKYSIESHRDFINNNFTDYINEKKLNEFISTEINDSTKFDTWEDEAFNNLPLEFVILLLTRIELNIRKIEREIIENIKKELRQLTRNDVLCHKWSRFDSLEIIW